MGRPQDCEGPDYVLRGLSLEELGGSHVDQLQVPICLHYDVLWLEVSVDNLVKVQILKL